MQIKFKDLVNPSFSVLNDKLIIKENVAISDKAEARAIVMDIKEFDNKDIVLTNED